MKLKASAIFIFFPLIILFVISCWNPFDARDPEPPSGETSHYKQPTTPQSALYNLQWSLMEKNIANFQSTLSDDYKFYFDAKDVQDFTSGTESWDLNKEIEITSALFNKCTESGNDTISVVFTEDSNNPDPTRYSASVTLYRRYRVVFPMTTYAPNDTIPAQGYMIITLVKDASSLWYISVWKDKRLDNARSDTLPTWGRVKWEFN
ncbi:MAG: hypothetical protein JXA60_07395 [Candidatus Coatesbacteria bacterium]|nr:hypothetical protein [Candidatus Coatesbacteria bacterium]